MKENNIPSSHRSIFRKSSLKEEVKLHVWPILGTLIANFLWPVLNPILRVPEKDAYAFELIFLLPLAVYVGVSGYTLNKLLKEKRSIELAWKNNSRADFEKYRDERIPSITHRFLTVLSFMLMLIIYSCPLSSHTGHLFTTTSSLIITYGWAWARELDDPFNGIYKLDIKAIEERWSGVCDGYREK